MFRAHPFLLLFTLVGTLTFPASGHVIHPHSPIRRAAGTVPALSGSAADITSSAGGTYPRALLLPDGAAILAAYARASPSDALDQQIALARSTDSGSTWTDVGTASTREKATSDLDNPFLLRLSSGRLLLAFRNHDKSPDGGGYAWYRITICYSDDSGESWSFLSTPAELAAAADGGAVGLWEPFLRLASDGTTVQLYYSKENGASDQDSILVTSADGGSTWSSERTISGGASVTARDGMLGVASVSGTTLMAVFETTATGRFTIMSVTSTDDGATWGDRKTVYTPAGTDNNAGAPQIINVGGTLVVSFMTDEDTQEHSWISGAASKLVTSGDGGETWGNKLQVFEPQANWPGMLSLEDGASFLYLSDHSGAKAQKVVLGS
ncbi:hypothetical protein MKZ38_003842 [Zalerion maritima]|uniref:Sialidase domain-containing protein n=1 Tax=Zalerion maritima TaxID=339359 RepID=A0AAD5RNL4_9PEZI|nr:hypothetical protein MKZ38_003842 [Zalerion maritima]